MKYTQPFFAALLTLVLASSCTDFIEKPVPAQDLPSDAAFNSVGGLETALIGAYDALQDSDFGANGLSMNSSLLSDNGLWRGSFPSYADMYERQLTPSNPEVFGFWEHAYEAINQANLILDNIGNVEDIDEATSNQLRGEALFIRGFVYFELARAFGKPYGSTSGSDLAVPIVLTATQTSADITFPARNTVEEVYNHATEDLTEARSLLSPEFDYGRATSTAATAVLADIAFQKRNYEQAAQLAKEVIETPKYMLTAEPQQPFFNEGSSEEIFSIVNTIQDNPGVNGSLATFHHRNGRGGDVRVSPDLRDEGYLAEISDDLLDDVGSDTLIDLRAVLLTDSLKFVDKYDDFANNSDDNIILRLPTYYLMRAEALVRTEGINEESVELLNTIRNRAIRRVNSDGAQTDASDIVSYNVDDFDSPEELIDAIVLERRVELAFEPNRLNDLRRLMRDVRGLDYDSDRLVFPIPQRELDANDQLIQNPGY